MKIVLCAVLLLITLASTATAQKKASRSSFFAEIARMQTLDTLIIKAGKNEIDEIFGSGYDDRSRINGCTLNLYAEDLDIGKIEYSDGAELIPRLAVDLKKMFDRLKIEAKIISVWREYLNLSYRSSNFSGFVTVRGTFKSNSSSQDGFVLYLMVSETFCNGVRK